MRPRHRALAAFGILSAIPACRGCFVDELTYEGGGGASSSGATSSRAATSSDASSPSASSSGDPASSGSGATASSGAGGDGAGSSSTGTGGNQGGGGSAGCPVSPVSDDFETWPGPCWQSLHADHAVTTHDDVAEEVTVVSGVDDQWWEEDETTYWYQRVRGDFTVALALRVDADPGGRYQLGGLLLRDPETFPSSWFMFATGKAEFSLTSEYVGQSIVGASVVGYSAGDGVLTRVLGLCRRGESVVPAVNRTGTGAWQVYGYAYDPEDDPNMPTLPEDVEIGFLVTAENAKVTATFEAFRVLPGGGPCEDALEELWP